MFKYLLLKITFFKKNRLRRILRGYRRMKESGSISTIDKIQYELTKQLLPVPANLQKKCNQFKIPIEKVLQQYLLSKYVVNHLPQYILESQGRINKPRNLRVKLPFIWQRILVNNGLNVSYFHSSVYWYFECIASLFRGVFLLVYFLAQFFIKKNNISVDEASYVYFYQTPSESLINNYKNFSNIDNYQDLYKWYSINIYKKSEKLIIFHSAKNKINIQTEGYNVIYKKSPFPRLCNILNFIKFLFFGVALFLYSFLTTLLGKWQFAILYGEILKSYLIYFSEKNILAKEYIFNNSGWVYRPLWTYLAELRGSKIIFFFYSTNCEKIKLINNSSLYNIGWDSSTWNNFLVWDQRQKEFVEEFSSPDASITVVGPIPLLPDFVRISVNVKTPVIALFDVSPMRTTVYNSLGLGWEYYIPEVVNKFILDVVTVAKKNNCTILFKSKRDVGARSHPLYRSLLSKLSNCENFIEIDSAVSAEELLRCSHCSISMPYTSTAVIGKFRGVPSFFYDSTGMCIDDDPAAHGIQVIKNQDSLNDLIKSLSFGLRIV